MNVTSMLSTNLSHYQNLEPFSKEDIDESKRLMDIYKEALITEKSAGTSIVGTSVLSLASLVCVMKSPTYLAALLPATAVGAYKCAADISDIMKKIHHVQYWRDEYLQANEAGSVTEATLRALNVVIKFGS